MTRPGTVPLKDGNFTFCVWAPAAEPVLLLGGEEHAMTPGDDGFWSAVAPAADGDEYGFRLGERIRPDPCSHHQPNGLRGLSAVTDARATVAGPGHTMADLVTYELHVGTFTPEGTLDAAAAKLGRLADLGVTAVELMPLAGSPGDHGWGYDGVYVHAVHEAYGGPHALARFTDAAHRHGIAVIADLVLNHVGASGEQALRAFGPYFTDRHETFWGEAIDFSQHGVREWAIGAAEHLVGTLGCDGLRLDAVHAIYDDSPEHVLAELCRRVDALVIAEYEHPDTRPLDEWGCDAQWADDLHHCIHTVLTGESEGYYGAFGTIAQLAAAYRTPFVRDGREEPGSSRSPERFVVCAQNHDQVGNRALGDRLREPLATFAALVSPYAPLIFMGEEHGEPAPFQFFTDHIDEEIANATREGRRREFADFTTFSAEDVPDPQDPATFMRSKLTWQEDPEVLAMVRALLAVRPDLPAVDDVEYDESGRWVRVRRGGYEAVMNFGTETLDLGGRDVVVATPGGTPGGPRSGALVR